MGISIIDTVYVQPFYSKESSLTYLCRAVRRRWFRHDLPRVGYGVKGSADECDLLYTIFIRYDCIIMKKFLTLDCCSSADALIMLIWSLRVANLKGKGLKLGLIDYRCVTVWHAKLSVACSKHVQITPSTRGALSGSSLNTTSDCLFPSRRTMSVSMHLLVVLKVFPSCPQQRLEEGPEALQFKCASRCVH